MGGSVAIHVAAKKAVSSLAGLIVIDVVEVCLLKHDLFILPIIVFPPVALIP